MASVAINVDTEAKTMTVSIDGTDVPNVSSVSAYTDGRGDYFYIDVIQYEKQDNKMSKTTRYSASGSEKFKEEGSKAQSKAGEQVQAAFEGFLLPNKS